MNDSKPARALGSNVREDFLILALNLAEIDLRRARCHYSSRGTCMIPNLWPVANWSIAYADKSFCAWRAHACQARSHDKTGSPYQSGTSTSAPLRNWRIPMCRIARRVLEVNWGLGSSGSVISVKNVGRRWWWWLECLFSANDT